ncbi:MarR family transcriptional regulator [Streptomyces sp. NPDC002309]
MTPTSSPRARGRHSAVRRCRLSTSELADACGLSGSDMSRLVNRIEEQALVRRARSPEDRRSLLLLLTPSGRTRLEQAWPTNLAGVRRHVFSRLQGV